MNLTLIGFLLRRTAGTKQLWNHSVSVYEHWDFLFAPLGKEAISDFRNRRASLPRVFWLIKNAPALLS